MLIFVTHHWLLLSVIVILILASVPVTAALEAYIDFKNRPKEPMMWCATCKCYFRKKHALPLFPELQGTAENSFVCPSCYYNAVFKTPNERLN